MKTSRFIWLRGSGRERSSSLSQQGVRDTVGSAFCSSCLIVKAALLCIPPLRARPLKSKEAFALHPDSIRTHVRQGQWVTIHHHFIPSDSFIRSLDTHSFRTWIWPGTREVLNSENEWGWASAQGASQLAGFLSIAVNPTVSAVHWWQWDCHQAKLGWLSCGSSHLPVSGVLGTLGRDGMDAMSCDHPGGNKRKYLRGLDTSLLLLHPVHSLCVVQWTPGIFLCLFSLGKILTSHLLSVSI